MPQALRHTLLSLRDLLVTAGPFVLLAAGLLALAYLWLDPTPPRRMVLATGVDQGAYAEFGKRYAAFLARHGIAVELRPTQGSAENIALLRDPGSGVDLAFVQGGSEAAPAADGAAADPNAGLQSLGSLFYEPVWLFYREDAARRIVGSDTLAGLAQLAGFRVNIGAAGSGVPPLMDLLVDANRIDRSRIAFSRQPLTPAVVEFLDGRLDAVVIASAPESLIVQMLLQTPGVRLLDFAQAEAYARRFPFMSPVVLPRGIVDLAADQPPADVRLIAPVATLIARDTLHPALVQLAVQAAREVHQGAGWFQRKGQFPNAQTNGLPLAREAERVYRDGPPWLQRYLPFWLANLVDRMWLALLSIVAVLIPLSRIVPPLYELRVRSRVFRWYGKLRAIEESIGDKPAEALLAQLDEVDARVGRISVPLSYADELYALRSHIQMVRRRLQAA